MNHFKVVAALLLIPSLVIQFASADEANPAPPPSAPAYSYPVGSTSGGVRVSPTSYMTITGYVTDKPVNGVFHLRNRRGRVFTVDFGQPEVPTDGTLRIYGPWNGSVLKATNFYYDDGLYGSRAYSESKEQIPTRKGTLTGTLMADAEPGGFDLRDSQGVIHSILTERVPKKSAAQPLRKGAKVIVSGDRSVRDSVSELDATRLVVLRRHP